MSRLQILMSYAPYFSSFAMMIGGYLVGKWQLRNKVAASKEEATIHEQQAPMDAVLKALERRDAEVAMVRGQMFELMGQRNDASLKLMTEMGAGIKTLVEQLQIHREEEAKRASVNHEDFHATQMLILGGKMAKPSNGNSEA